MGICLVIALSFITLAPRYIAAYEVEIFFVLETILGPIWVWLFIYEQPTTKTFIGGICIILIILSHTLSELRKKKLRLLFNKFSILEPIISTYTQKNFI